MNLQLKTDFDDVKGSDAESATFNLVSILVEIVVVKGGTSRQVRLYRQR